MQDLKLKIFDFGSNFKVLQESKFAAENKCVLQTSRIDITKSEIKKLIFDMFNIRLLEVKTLIIRKTKKIRAQRNNKQGDISGVNFISRYERHKKIIMVFKHSRDLKTFIECITSYKI